MSMSKVDQRIFEAINKMVDSGNLCARCGVNNGTGIVTVCDKHGRNEEMVHLCSDCMQSMPCFQEES